jgi:hypothetical protein
MRDFADSLKENAAQNTTENTLENTTKTPWNTLRFVVGHANALAGVRHYCNTRSPKNECSAPAGSGAAQVSVLAAALDQTPRTDDLG